MRLTSLFTKTRKNYPSDETARNAQLLIQAGFIHKEMAGVYGYLPLGIKVLEKIKKIVREEMDAIDSQELILTNLQSPEIWKSTGRWDEKNVDVWFKTSLQDGAELGLAWSHEEPILNMMSQHINSYKDLPVSVYQFQTKLRNELRAKSGIMRGREFVMKDMYSLHATQKDMDDYYDRAIEAYKKVYSRLGIGDETFVTFASGGSFTKFSHEFQTLCEAGEDTLYVNKDKSVAVNEEVLADATKELGVDKKDLEAVTSAEVGNIFKFGTEKSEKMSIEFTDLSGKRQPVYLASYGIGISRLMGVIAEKNSDEKGLVWPDNIAPAKVFLAPIGNDAAVLKAANKLYDQLQDDGIDVLYDDREVSAGQKFADADLMGLPFRVVLSEKSIKAGGFELKKRTDDINEVLSEVDLMKRLAD
jgi:prolyl-tRNA synthetase